MRFKIDGRLYEAASVDRLSLAQILRLESETAALGRPMKWSQLRQMVDEISTLQEGEFDAHDDAPWVVALTIWASRLNAGENLSFAEAIDFPLADLEYLPDPQDHQAPAGKASARKGTGAGGKRQAAASA